MIGALLVFVLVTGAVLGVYFAVTHIPQSLARRRMERRLREVGSTQAGTEDEAVLVKSTQGPLPSIDRVMAGTRAGSGLASLIEQSGVRVAPSGIVVMSLALGVLVGFVTHLFVRIPLALFVSVPLGMSLPTLFLMQRRKSRLRAFEEQFPDALDLVSRAIRAGHAFQTALGMAADELPAPVGPECKKMFDQQNFGLPLRDALEALTQRVPL